MSSASSAVRRHDHDHDNDHDHARKKTKTTISDEGMEVLKELLADTTTRKTTAVTMTNAKTTDQTTAVTKTTDQATTTTTTTAELDQKLSRNRTVIVRHFPAKHGR